MERAVGIDLGTTNSAIAVIEHGKAVVIPNAEGSPTTPSVVAFRSGDTPLVGLVARRQAVLEPERTISSAKRFIGRSWNESRNEAQQGAFRTVEGAGGIVRFSVDRALISPEEVSAHIIRKLVRDASRALGEPITHAVITVPAYFSDSQRQATHDAGRIAGLRVLRIVSEPTAAALAYGLDRRQPETVMVFDLGGGTFDVSILDVGNGVCAVRATSGDSRLGGNDFDQRIVEWLSERFRRENGFDPRQDPQAHQRMLEAAENAKCELSTASRTMINLPFLSGDGGAPIHLNEILTREAFEESIADLLTRCIKPTKQALADAGIGASEVDDVLLVGGSTRIPAVQRLVKEVMGGREPRLRVNPDEVVALGAAIQAGTITGTLDSFSLIDVIPLSLGVETVGGVMSRIAERNTPIPLRRTEVFTTAEDGQETVEIVLLQGERELAKDNRRLGRLRLDGIRPAPRGVPQIEVTFEVNADGILRVSATDRDTGRRHAVRLEESVNLGARQIEQMIREAEANAGEDRNRKRRIDLLNETETCVYHFRRTVRIVRKAAPAVELRRGDALVRNLREALNRGEPPGQIRELMYDLEQMVRMLAVSYGEGANELMGSMQRRKKRGRR